MEGVVFTMYDVRTKLSNQVVENVKENLDTKIYETMIPRNIRLAEAPSYGIRSICTIANLRGQRVTASLQRKSWVVKICKKKGSNNGS